MENNEKKKNNLLLYICILIFAASGVYLTFFYGDMSKYDKNVVSYRMEVREEYDSDGTLYYPTYYYRVNGNEYKCDSRSGSSFTPTNDKEVIYYDSANPNNCAIKGDMKMGKILGVVLIVVAIVILYFGIIKKDKTNENEPRQLEEIDPEKQQEIAEKIEKTVAVVSKIGLIIKRIIIGIVILILLFFIWIDIVMIKQTIKAKDYIETTATLVSEKNNEGKEASDIFDDYIYTFEDKKKEQQEIVISVSKGEEPSREVKIKYDENNPKEFYEDGSTYDTSGIIWFVVKIIILILLIKLFFTDSWLNKISMSVNRG